MYETIKPITTLLKFLKYNPADKQGKIIKLEINKDPINLIPSTTIIEHKLASIIL